MTNEKDKPSENPQTIGELYDLAHSRKTGEDKKVGLKYARVSDDMADRMQRELALDAHGCDHQINEQFIRHAEKGHDEDGEWRGDQVPVTKADYEMIPDVVGNPERIKIVGYTWQNLPIIQFKKRVNGHLLVLEVFHGGKRSRYLEFLSLYKYRHKPGKGEAS